MQPSRRAELAGKELRWDLGWDQVFTAFYSDAICGRFESVGRNLPRNLRPPPPIQTDRRLGPRKNLRKAPGFRFCVFLANPRGVRQEVFRFSP